MSSPWPINFSTTRHFEKSSHHLLDKAFAHYKFHWPSSKIRKPNVKISIMFIFFLLSLSHIGWKPHSECKHYTYRTAARLYILGIFSWFGAVHQLGMASYGHKTMNGKLRPPVQSTFLFGHFFGICSCVLGEAHIVRLHLDLLTCAL